MSVLPFQPRSLWVWDARGHDRAVRITAHTNEGLVNLSVWRDDFCVGTVRLPPAEVAGLVAGLTEGLARLAEQPSGSAREDAEKLAAMEERLAVLEAQVTRSGWRAAVAGAAGRAQQAVRAVVTRG